MELGPFYTGQVPSEPLSIVVRDSFSNEPVDLSAYTEAAVVIVDPEGAAISPEGEQTEWPAEIANPTGGEVQVQLETSPFLVVGDHQMQVILRRTGAEDVSSTLSVEVYRRLGG